ncbi:hypothetical protein PFISCL1PPCAC_12751, partial [Pristionchus fissidentatus]
LRSKMGRWNPCEDEFVAVLALSFWSLEKIDVSESVHQLAENYRRLIFAQLDKLYRKRMGVNEYAARMGEALMFLASVQV